MDHDGTKGGFALEITDFLTKQLSIPVIASGGAGAIDHFKALFAGDHADAALAASIFHFKEVEIVDLKEALLQEGVPVRV